MLDYVIPYVNERKAFGEPISHRQAVAFAVADMAIELEGMRLLTLRAAARADAGEPFAREVALARALCATKGGRSAPTAPAARRPRLRQGAPGRALVPRPRGGRRDGRGAAGLMIHLELPRRLLPLATQAAQVADEVFRPISRRYDREEHTRPKELDMLAALIEGMEDGGDTGGAGATGVRRGERRGRRATATARAWRRRSA